MNLYIKIENGKPVDHPAFMDNLIQAFGAVPSNWEQFIRIERPVPTVYQILDSQEPTYEFNEQLGYWTDTWALRDMTDVEKTAKQQAIKDAWAAKPNVANFLAWIFNEDTCQYEPPIPRPEGAFKWDGATNSWVAIAPAI
jgi:hypothetical protein